MRADKTNSESGVALIIVLLVLLLTSILALEIKASAALHMRLATNERDDFLMREGMRGHLEVVKQVLLYDMKEGDNETLEDRWTEDKYTQFQEGRAADAERDPDEPVSSRESDISARVEDEARKFNLHNLLVEDEELNEHWGEIFVRLLTLYREDFSQHSISPSKAELHLDKVREWLKRKDDDKIPRPATAVETQVMITPDELLMVEGFTREMLYDLPPDDEGEPSPPGLLRFLTLWSEGPVNMNTAEPVMIYSLFQQNDRDVADNFLSWREEEAEEQPEDLPSDADPKKNALKGPGDLANIDGFDAEIIQRNRLNPSTVAVRSNVFSVHLMGESPDGLTRQERWVVRRSAGGFDTILMEERNDPSTDSTEEE